MNRLEKKDVVADLNRSLKGASSVVIAHYRGMGVAEMNDLRVKMREVGARLRVTKNRLVRLAVEGTPYESLSKFFTGPVAIAYSDDLVAPAKVCVNFAKQNEKLIVVGGAMGKVVLDANAVQELATLPSLDELRGKIVGLLQAPATKVAGVLQAPASQLARVIDAHVQAQS